MKGGQITYQIYRAGNPECLTTDLSESAKDDALTLYNGNPDFIDGVNAAYAMAVETLGIHFHFHF